ncbi:MAG: L,D-transpeptidase family protein [Lachnospiraceae bacterium]|nr:L,D-transpeptidase family protein [Lachnospiraceae bacterium]MEE3460303.1 L,D-transpeptidase family protein [Lachnospiraceae bacterium]
MMDNNETEKAAEMSGEEKNRPGKGRIITLISIGSVIVLLFAVCTVLWVVKPVVVKADKSTKVVRLKGLKNFVNEKYKGAYFTVREKGNDLTSIKFTDIVEPEFYEDRIKDTESDGMISYMSDMFSTKDLYTWKLKDNGAYRDIFQTINESRKPAVDAYLKEGDRHYTIEGGTTGTVIDIDKAETGILSAIKKGEVSGDLNDMDVYEKPRYVKEDFTEAAEKLNSICTFSVSYTDGQKFDWDFLKDYVKVDDCRVTYQVAKAANAIIDKIRNDYSTIGKTRHFKTHDGRKIKVTGGTYGCVMNEKKEKALIKKALLHGRDLGGREPVFIQRSVYGDGNEDLGDTYIEVSRDEQHLWYYKGGKVIMETDVVTGKYGEHDTPEGVYFISEHIPGKFLVGEDYKTWVNQWMRLTNGGVGLHDAPWRGRFGGTIYKSGGSHGCINLPPAFAEELFKKTPNNLPVVIY